METIIIKIEDESEDEIESDIDLLYRNHVIKEEMVIGPVVLRQAVHNYNNRHHADGCNDDGSDYGSEAECPSKKRIKREFEFEMPNTSSVYANLPPRASIDTYKCIPPAPMYINEPPSLHANQPHKATKPPLDANKPPFDASKTPFNVRKPPLYVNKPPFHTNKPPLNADVLRLNADKPLLDANKPSFDVSKTPLNINKPPLYVIKPPFHTNKPPLNADVLRLNADMSLLDANKPPFDTSKTPLNINKPPLYVIKSPFHTNKPSLNADMLRLNADKPLLDANKPPFDASKTPLNINKPPLYVNKPPFHTNKPLLNADVLRLNANKPPLEVSKPMDSFKPQSLLDFDWVSLPDPAIPWHERREKFSENRGSLGIFANPYNTFVSIWDRNVMNMIALETNRYAKQCIHQIEMGLDTQCENSFQSWWNDTNADELYVFFGLIIAMGVVVKSDINEYWSINNDTFDTPNFGLHMSCRRFQLLGRLLHFTNNEDRPSNLTEFESRVYKIAPIVQHLNKKFQALFQLGHSIAIEETLELKNTWPSILNKFIKNNTAGYGVKSYEVSDVDSGYLWRFDVHADEDKKTPEETTSLVLELLEGLEYKGHTVFVDNFINSPVLARLLKSRGFDCVGRLRLNSQYVPKQLTELNKQSLALGTIQGFTSGDVDILVWRDVNINPLISTYHGLQASCQNEKLTPILVQDLNTCMRVVDQRDQMLAGNPIEKKGAPVWYKKFFRRLLNVSVFNSFILHKESGIPEHPHPHVTKHRQFRKILVNMLLEKHAKPSSILQPIQPNSSRVKLSQLALKHMPVEYAFNEECKEHPRHPCAWCRAPTKTRCPGCNVPLCLGTCFSKYHS